MHVNPYRLWGFSIRVGAVPVPYPLKRGGYGTGTGRQVYWYTVPPVPRYGYGKRRRS